VTGREALPGAYARESLADLRQNPRVFDHVEIRVVDLDASTAFYTLALGDPTYDSVDLKGWDDFAIVRTSADRPVARRLHVGFGAHDREEVDGWWERMTAAGYVSDGDPGARPAYSESYYGAFVRDPDGNSIESVHHHRTNPEASRIDHLWLRTRNVADAKRFYETIASVVGIELAHDTPDRVRFSDGVGSFSFVHGDEPTENVHLAFGVGSRAAVDEFHGAAVSAGYEDNGAPGERPHYHPGYYGAFVLDPDGHNVEAVFHDRG
jgi:catechol 2,3-dioxygenase-like lactoylglutathione lyase family enzyme